MASSEPGVTSEFRAFKGLKWVVVKITVPFWVLNIIRHLVFRGPKKGTIILTTTQMCCASLERYSVAEISSNEIYRNGQPVSGPKGFCWLARSQSDRPDAFNSSVSRDVAARLSKELITLRSLSYG